jgi:hypothetical protein
MDRLRAQNAGLRVNQQSQPVNVNYKDYTVNQKAPDTLMREISALEPEQMTPLEALSLLNEWKRRFAAEKGAVPPVIAKSRGGKAADSSPSLFD